MKRPACVLCGGIVEITDIYGVGQQAVVTRGMCPSCKAEFEVELAGGRRSMGGILDRFDFPVFVVDADGIIKAANKAAAGAVGKSSSEIQGLKGGEVFECVYARLPGGCGNTEHCLACTVRTAVLESVTEGKETSQASSYIHRMTAEGVKRIEFTVSVKSVGDFALLRIDEIRA